MRHIGNVETENQARLFGDYLYTRGIRNQVEPDGDNSWMIWVADEAQLDDARNSLVRFRANPSSPEFSHGAAGAEALRSGEARDMAAYRKRFYTRQRVFPGGRNYSAGVLTYVLIVICALVSFYSHFGRNDELLRFLFISNPTGPDGGFLPEVRSGEVWRLFTPAIIHFGFPHLLFNMMWLFQLGSMIEGRRGHATFALLTLVLAVGSNVSQAFYYYERFHFVLTFGGMSGVIYGLFGYVWLRGKFDPASGLYIDKQNVVLMIVWFFLCLSGWVGPIANVAHGAGLVLGLVWGFVSAQIAQRAR